MRISAVGTNAMSAVGLDAVGIVYCRQTAKRLRKTEHKRFCVYIIHKKVDVITEKQRKIDIFVKICYNNSKTENSLSHQKIRLVIHCRRTIMRLGENRRYLKPAAKNRRR